MNKFVIGFVKVTGWLPYFFASRTKIYYQDKKIQSRKIKGPAIIISNHKSICDFATIMYTFSKRILRCVIADIVSKKSKASIRFMKQMGTIPINRETKDTTFVNECLQILKDGGIIEIFPEGRLHKKGEENVELLPFSHIASFLSYNSGVKIIPVYITGKYGKKERNRRVIGKPIYVKNIINKQLSKKTNINNITKHLEKTVLELKNEIKK